jgi:hypothetical protein
MEPFNDKYVEHHAPEGGVSSPFGVMAASLTRRTHPLYTQAQYIFKFPSGWGASVIQGRFTNGGNEGLWELAVLHQDRIHYDTPIARGDVVGYLTDDGVSAILETLAADDWAPQVSDEDWPGRAEWRKSQDDVDALLKKLAGETP